MTVGRGQTAPLRQRLEAIARSKASTSTQAWAAWLADHLLADGRALHIIAEAAGVSPHTLDRALNAVEPVTDEPIVRRLAGFFGQSEDATAAIAGYPAASFHAWLMACLSTDGRSNAAVARALGIAPRNLLKLRQGGRPAERTARAAAVVYGADPDRIAALAGYADRSKPVPEPRLYLGRPDALEAWLKAALAAWSITPFRASMEAKHPNVLAEFFRNKGGMDRQTIRDFADYFRVNPRALLKLRPGNKELTPDARRAASRKGGVTNRRKRGPAYFKRISRQGNAALAAKKGIVGVPTCWVCRDQASPLKRGRRFHGHCWRMLRPEIAEYRRLRARERAATDPTEQGKAAQDTEAFRAKMAARVSETPPKRPRGRPKGSASTRLGTMTRKQIIAAYRRLVDTHDAQHLGAPTQVDFCTSLGGCNRKTLERALDRHKLVWPPTD